MEARDGARRSGKKAGAEPRPTGASKTPQFVAAVIGSLPSFSNGFMFPWPSVALPQLQSKATPLGGEPLSNEEASWVAAIMYLTATLCMLPWSWVAGRLSRKMSGYVVGTLFAAQWVVIWAAPTGTVADIYAGRALAGAAVAGMFFFVPAYINEVAEEHLRGALGALFALSFNVAALALYGAGAVLSYNALLLFCFACSCIFLATFWAMPETPVYLIGQGRSEEAAASLQRLRGAGADVSVELEALEAAARRRRSESDSSSPLRALLSDRASARGLLIAGILCANQPLCGFFVVLSYSVAMFEEAGVPMDPAAAAAVPAAVLLLGSAASSWLVERAGRRPLYLVSDTGLTVALGVLGVYSYAKYSGADVALVAWLPVAALALFMATAALGVATLPFVVITEIFPPEGQQVATTLGGGLILGLAFVANKFYPAITGALGLHGCYWLFSALCAAITVFIYFFLPETKGRSLESIRKDLGGEKDDSAEMSYM